MWQRIKAFLFENKNSRQTIVKNTVWLSISNFGGRLFKAAIVIYGARVIGAAGYGVFSYAVTLAGFFGLFVDPGINSIFIREGSKASPGERHSLFATTLLMKAAMMVIGVLVIIFIAPFFSTLPGAKALLPFVALIIVFDSTREFLSSVFRTEEKMQWDAAAFLAANISIAIFGFIFLERAATPFSFTSAYVVGTAVGAGVAIWLLRKNFTRILENVSTKRMVTILKAAWPFAVVGGLGALLTNADILIISWMKSAADVGIYAAAIRIIQVLYIVPSIIQLSTLPIFSRLAKHDNEKFRTALERTLALIFLVSIPLSLGGAILGTQIMHFVFGVTYASGGAALSILMISLLFDYTGGVVASAIFAYDHQKSLIVCSAIAGVSNVLFDLLFIPHWGMTGSAIATLIAQILSNSYLWYSMKKLNRFHVLPHVGKIALASVCMAAVTILLFFARTNILVNIILSGIVYVGMLYVLKESVLSEIKAIVSPKTIVA